ncbi:MAG: hypothetical protein IMY67_01825 [Bacteroidetes bacterium]|nr:hypothetical protein [Bacteroidota bacterium]
MIISNDIGNYLVGEFTFSNDIKETSVVFIDKLEKEITKQLLGYELFKQFNADLLDGSPVSQKWVDFVDGTDYELDSVLKEYTGILDMLQYYVLSKLITEYQFFQTSMGLRKLKGDNSDAISILDVEKAAIGKYNYLLPFYRKAYEYIYNNNEVQQGLADSIVDNLDGTYTVLLSSTTNINNYQKVKFGIDYEVTGLILNTSFVIKETVGHSFNLDFSFEKYGNLISIPKSHKKLITY